MSEEVQQAGALAPIATATDPARRYFKWGAIGSAVYIAGLILFASIFVGPNAFLKMKPNEVGDLLAGIFSPLAFLWLVLGFLQQGQELRQSSDALRMQGAELQNSVEQQKRIAEQGQEELELMRQDRDRLRKEADQAIAPYLSLVFDSAEPTHPGVTYHFILRNTGQPCTEIKIHIDGYDIIKFESIPMHTAKRVNNNFSNHIIEPLTVTIECRDVRGQKRKQNFTIIPRVTELGSRPEIEIEAGELEYDL